jgi:hypothetical protein
MTHPTLGYTNFRFADSDAVHMAAFNGAGHIIACNAEGPTEHDLWPFGVDAPVDCPKCLRARESDWWMAQSEQARRDGAEATWPEPQSSDSQEISHVADRLVEQVNARMEAAILGTGERTEEFLGIDYGFDEAQPSIVDDQTAMQSITERLKPTVQSAFLGEVIDRHDNDARLARYLARSPLAYLASESSRSQLTGKNPDDTYWRELHTGERFPADANGNAICAVCGKGPIDPASTCHPSCVDTPASITDSVRAAIEAAQETLADHPFGDDDSLGYWAAVPESEKGDGPVNIVTFPDGSQTEIFASPHDIKHDCTLDSCSGMSDDNGPCGGCCSCLGGCVYDIDTHGSEVVIVDGENDYPDVNWCHVHNRQAIQGREECQSCMADRCERCNHDAHRCPGCGAPLQHGTEVCTACTAVNVREGETAS